MILLNLLSEKQQSGLSLHQLNQNQQDALVGDQMESPVDPTPVGSPGALTTTQYSRDLSILYIRLAKVDSHLSFVSTCLRRHCIPRGLHIKLKPCVSISPCQEFAARLQKEWLHTIKRASINFLAALKRYHRSCAQHLRLQVTNLERLIISRTGQLNTASLINTAKANYTIWQHRLRERRQRKLNNLLPPRSHDYWSVSYTHLTLPTKRIV